MFSKSFIFSFISTMLLMNSNCFAKNINLYQDPKSDAKIVGSINPEAGVVPIYTSKTGDWVKVGNPNNGNVGWVKSSDLVQSGVSNSGFSFTQQIVNTGKGPESYVFKLGVPAKLSKEQSDALYNQVMKQQAIIQQGMQKVIQDVFTNYNQMSGTGFGVPIIVPVVVTPNAPAAKTTPSATSKAPIPATTTSSSTNK